MGKTRENFEKQHTRASVWLSRAEFARVQKCIEEMGKASPLGRKMTVSDFLRMGIESVLQGAKR